MRYTLFKTLPFILIFNLGLIFQVYSTPNQRVKNLQYDSQLWTSLSPNNAKKSGLDLMALPYGLHQLSPPKKRGPLIILVHGFKSRGYEWVYAAKQLYTRGEVYLYRWNWALCPQEGALGLQHALSGLLQQRPRRRVEIFGHSYGGVISAVLAAQYKLDSTINIQIIASPLAGYKDLESTCKPSIKALIAPLADGKLRTRPKVIQWKTVHELDGAFKHLNDDPQYVTWPDVIHSLPRTYKGHRLGHIWSISAVVDQVLSLP